MNGKPEERPATVAAGSTQAGEARGPEAEAATPKAYPYAERAVWTERMLQALATGVKGGVWFSLIDKVWSPKNLRAAWMKVRENRGAGGVDGVDVEQFERKADEYLERLSDELKTGNFEPTALRRAYVPKLGTNERRPLGIPTVADRVVQGALKNVLEPIFEREFEPSSYGFRPGRGAKDALRCVERALKSGATWVVDADFRKCFDTIPHAGIMDAVRKKVGDGRVLELIEGFLKSGVMEDGAERATTAGTPQGGVISPLLANIHLHRLDVAFREGAFELVRYADDLVVMCRTREKAEDALSLLKDVATRLGLDLHPEKTRIADATSKEGFEFLGFRFAAGRRWPRRTSEQKLRGRLRSMTPKTDGIGLDERIKMMNRTLKGWFAYFKHATRGSFTGMDGWIRRRLRSILRKHLGMHGIAAGNGADNVRWPIEFFRQRGLFILTDAHEALLRSIATR